MNNKSIACCLLTYNHPETVEDVLTNIGNEYYNNGIDIYIYDSSDNDKTKEIVDKLRMTCNGLYYVDAHGLNSGDEKYLYILRQDDIASKYDYVWICKDRCYFTGNVLSEIQEFAQDDYDVIFAVNENDRWELGFPQVKNDYSNHAEFFSHYGQLSTNWEAMIRKTSSMITGIDWDKYEKKYLVGGDNNFNQTITIFARLDEIDDRKIKVIHHKPEEKKYSKLSDSMWTDQIYEIWIEKWIPSVLSLPESYDEYKQAIIKSQLSMPFLFGSTDRLIYMMQNGQLTAERYEGLKMLWGMISDIPASHLEYIYNNQIEQLCNEVVKMLTYAFSEKDYSNAYYIFNRNRWLEDILDKEVGAILNECFRYYKYEIDYTGTSKLFEGIDSIDGLIEKYKKIKEKK